jgi:mycofactocin precursor
MTDQPITGTEQPGTTTATSPEEPVAEDLLVEEVSIDGMCGVY